MRQILHGLMIVGVLSASAMAREPLALPGVFEGQLPPAPGSALQPIPQSGYYPPAPAYGAGPAYAPVYAEPLYDNVKYRDLRNIHPCAVEKIVSVPDPCQDPCDPCSKKCVSVKICVPPCDCPEKVKVTRNGNKIRYDYGQYAVDITSTRRGVIVDYDD
jgi:hypothetical protein